MSARFAIAFVTFAALTALVRSASADTFSLRYEVARGCPSSDEFEAAVTRVSSRIAFAPDAPSSERIVVTVTSRGASFVGDVALGARPHRTVDGPTCAEVVDALALVTALALDPMARLPASRDLPPPPPPSPPPAPPMPPPHTAQPIEPPTLAASTFAEPKVGPRAFHGFWLPPTHTDLDAAATLRTGLAPVSMFGAVAGATLASRVDGVWAPDIRLALAYATTGPFDGAAPDATYKLLAAALVTCPVRLAPFAGASLSPCLGTDLGVVLARGESKNVESLTGAAPFWADVTLGARGRVGLAGPLFVRFDAGAAFSVVQPSFVFEQPVRKVSYVSGVGFVGSVGLGLTVH